MTTPPRFYSVNPHSRPTPPRDAVMVPIDPELLALGEFTKEPLHVRLEGDAARGYSIAFQRVAPPQRETEPCRDCLTVGGHKADCARYAEWVATLSTPAAPSEPSQAFEEQTEDQLRESGYGARPAAPSEPVAPTERPAPTYEEVTAARCLYIDHAGELSEEMQEAFSTLSRAITALRTPPLPSAEPDGWEVRTFFEDGKLLDTLSFLDDPVRASRIREYIAIGKVRGAMTPLYRTTPPAAAPFATYPSAVVTVGAVLELLESEDCAHDLAHTVDDVKPRKSHTGDQQDAAIYCKHIANYLRAALNAGAPR